MTTYIAILRGINVGQNQLKMEDLRACLGEMGFAGIRTYIQSGNVVFQCPPSAVRILEKQLEEKIASQFGLKAPVIIRDSDEWEKILNGIPFSLEHDPKTLHVTFLDEAPDPSLMDEILPYKAEAESFVLKGKEVYLHCPNGYGTSKLSNNLFEKKLKVKATTRNWNTVQQLYILANHPR